MGLRFRSPIIKVPSGAVEKGRLIEIGSINGYTQWAEVSRELIRSLSSTTVKIDTSSTYGQTEAFGRCAPLAAIVGKLAEYSQNGRYYFADKDGNEKNPGGNLPAILLKPNLLQTWPEFISSALAFTKLHGQCYILPVTPAGYDGRKGSARSLFVIPNWMVTPNYTGNSFYQTDIRAVVTSYRVQGFKNAVPPEDMIVVRDTMPTVVNGDQNKIFEGQSRLIALSDTINYLIAIQDTIYTMTTRRGAMGAWVPENGAAVSGQVVPLRKDDKDKVLEAFQEYGVQQGKKSPFMVLDIAMRWVQAAMNLGDLKVFEGNDAGIVQVAMAYNVSTSIIGIKDVKYDNQAAAEKAAYTNAVIPCVQNICSAISAYFGLTGVTLTAVFDHLDVFQKSKKDEADALNSFLSAMSKAYRDKIITRQEYRNMMAAYMPEGVPFDPARPEGNEYYDGQDATLNINGK